MTMLYTADLLSNKPEIIEELQKGTLQRVGGVLRQTSTGQIRYHILDHTQFGSQFEDSLTDSAKNATQLASEQLGLQYEDSFIENSAQSPEILTSLNFQAPQASNQLINGHSNLFPALKLAQVSASANILNLGVSLAGFAYTAYKLNHLQKDLGTLQNSIKVGFDSVDKRFDNLSTQLSYVYSLVEHSIQEQKQLSAAVSKMHRAFLMQELANLQAEALNRTRYPNSSSQEFLKVASRSRMFLSDQATSKVPKLEVGEMLFTDIATQGWAVATAAEAHLLLEAGKADEAFQVLRSEVPRFREVAANWIDCFSDHERPQLSTAYRFSAPRLKKYISEERIERIASISSKDRDLSFDAIRRKKKDVEVELNMSYNNELAEDWVMREVAKAEFVDGLSELYFRLMSLQDFARFCKAREQQGCLTFLPNPEAPPGIYVLNAEDGKR